MTPGQAQWIMWLFGAVCGVACGWLAASMLHRSKRVRLRDALERLVGACMARERLTGEPNRWLGIALKRARDVLNAQP